MYECRCNERLPTKRFTRLTHTGLVVELEYLKIKTRLTNEKFASVKGDHLLCFNKVFVGPHNHSKQFLSFSVRFETVLGSH
jgi:hypothetical protein